MLFLPGPSTVLLFSWTTAFSSLHLPCLKLQESSSVRPCAGVWLKPLSSYYRLPIPVEISTLHSFSLLWKGYFFLVFIFISCNIILTGERGISRLAIWGLTKKQIGQIFSFSAREQLPPFCDSIYFLQDCYQEWILLRLNWGEVLF